MAECNDCGVRLEECAWCGNDCCANCLVNCEIGDCYRAVCSTCVDEDHDHDSEVEEGEDLEDEDELEEES